MKREDFDKLPEILREYIVNLDVIKNKSPLTVLEYASDIQMFLRFMKLQKKNVDRKTSFDEIDIADIDISFIKEINLNDGYQFLSYCKNERHNDSKTRARKVVSLKSFFKYLAVKKKLLTVNPFEELEAPKIKKSLPKYLSLEQSRMLLNCIDGKYKERDYCIILLFLNCGLRLAELVGLNLTDISDDNSIKVTGKGNKERIIYLNNACVEAINRYLKVRPVEYVKDPNALFISRNMQRISRRTVQDLIEKYLDRCGLKGYGFSTHKLRHTAATLMYQHSDVDVLLIKEILGHENLSTTQIYTHVSDEQLRNAMNLNPLNDVEPDDDSKT